MKVSAYLSDIVDFLLLTKHYQSLKDPKVITLLSRIEEGLPEYSIVGKEVHKFFEYLKTKTGVLTEEDNREVEKAIMKLLKQDLKVKEEKKKFFEDTEIKNRIQELRNIFLTFYMKEYKAEVVKETLKKQDSLITEFYNKIEDKISKNTVFKRVGEVGAISAMIGLDAVSGEFVFNALTIGGAEFAPSFNPSIKAPTEPVMNMEPPDVPETPEVMSYDEWVNNDTAAYYGIKGYFESAGINYREEHAMCPDRPLADWVNEEDYVILDIGTIGYSNGYPEIHEYRLRKVAVRKDVYEAWQEHYSKETYGDYENSMNEYIETEINRPQEEYTEAAEQYEREYKQWEKEFEAHLRAMGEQAFWTSIINNVYCLAMLPLIKYFNQRKSTSFLSKMLAFNNLHMASGRAISTLIDWNQVPKEQVSLMQTLLRTKIDPKIAVYADTPLWLIYTLNIGVPLLIIFGTFKMLSPSLPREERKKLYKKYNLKGATKGLKLSKILRTKRKEEKKEEKMNHRIFAENLIKIVIQNKEVIKTKVDTKKLIKEAEKISKILLVNNYLTEEDKKSLKVINQHYKASKNTILQGKSELLQLKYTILKRRITQKMRKKHYKKLLNQTQEELKKALEEEALITAYYTGYLQAFFNLNYYNIKRIKNKINKSLKKIYEQVSPKSEFYPLSDFSIMNLIYYFDSEALTQTEIGLYQNISRQIVNSVRESRLKPTLINSKYNRLLKESRKYWTQVLQDAKTLENQVVEYEKTLKKDLQENNEFFKDCLLTDKEEYKKVKELINVL